MSIRNYKAIIDTDLPLSRQAVIVWMGFSEEGQLFTYDSEGVLRSLSFANKQWSPVLDFKGKHSEVFDRLWISGISDGEVLAIEMARDHQAPLIA